MFRKIAILISVLSLFGAFAVANAESPTDGCFVEASPVTIKEEDTVTFSLKCAGIDPVNHVFAFQIGTTRDGSIEVSETPGGYTPASDFGGFFNADRGATTAPLPGTNALDGLFAASRVNNEIVTQDNFAIGSYTLTAENNLTADGFITVAIKDDSSFILSDDTAARLVGDWVSATYSVEVPVINIDLAWLNGSVDVQSDFSTIESVASVTLDIGSEEPHSASDVTPDGNVVTTFTMAGTKYFEVGKPVGDASLLVDVTADMTGHQACSNTINLGDTGGVTSVTTKVGIGGVITLKAGDADNDGLIDVDDALLIASNYGTVGSGEENVNGDSVIDVLDLVYVGRNYDATAASCGTGA